MTDRTPVLLMATRGDDAEPVLVAQTSTEVILTLDDGTELRFDFSELFHALGSRSND